MKWRIPFTVQAPVPAQALAKNCRYHALVELPAPLFRVHTTSLSGESDTSGSEPINHHLRHMGLEGILDLPDLAGYGPPAPWRVLDYQADSDALQQARAVELACALRIIPRPPHPADPALTYPALADVPELQQRIYEAVGFALIDLNVHWDRRNSLLATWEQGVRTVLHERTGSAPRRPCSIPLLQAGFDLLTVIAGLREARLSLDDLERTWDEFQNHQAITPPLAFALAFWNEATYRLTEQGDTGQAAYCSERVQSLSERLMAALPGIDEALQGGMWWHHLGRLAYYEGDFPGALDFFAREWQIRGSVDSTRQARLIRNTASVITDIGYLSTAERLTRAALEIQERNAEPERYKTWGRLGEILLRQQRLAEGGQAYQRSLALQDATERDGQTLVYLGHTALLTGDLETARLWYDEAESFDTRRGVMLNPYLWMGRVALCLRSGTPQDIGDIWEIYGSEIRQREHAQVLPAAVIVTGLYRAGLCNSELLETIIQRLLATNYAIEALYPLPLAFAEPALASALLARIRDQLTGWRDAYRRFAAQAQLGAVDEQTNLPSPDRLLPAIDQCLAENQWAALTPWRAALFPMNLLE